MKSSPTEEINYVTDYNNSLYSIMQLQTKVFLRMSNGYFIVSFASCEKSLFLVTFYSLVIEIDLSQYISFWLWYWNQICTTCCTELKLFW